MIHIVEMHSFVFHTPIDDLQLAHIVSNLIKSNIHMEKSRISLDKHVTLKFKRYLIVNAVHL